MGILNLSQPEKKPEPVADTEVKEENKEEQQEQQMILMDGPLSSIYTKALDLVYAQRTRHRDSQETQQTDMVMVADAHKLMANVNDEHDEKVKGAYIYVTDEPTVSEDGAMGAFDSLRIALDMKNISSHYLCIEGFSGSTCEVILVNFAKSNGYKIFYDRQRLLESIKGGV